MTERHLRAIDGDAADAAIDRAIREIMTGEPAPGFRQRVFARLERESHTQSIWAIRTIWTGPRLGFAAIAAVAVLVFALWTRPAERTNELPVAQVTPPAIEHRPPSAPQPVTQTPSGKASISPTPRVADRRTPAGAAKSPARTTPTRVVTAPADRRISAASVAPAEEALERSTATQRPPDDPTSIPPIQVRPLETPEIIVRPLAVGPLMIVPLLPPR